MVHLSKPATVFGRAPTCDVAFDAPSAPTMISRAHACIERMSSFSSEAPAEACEPAQGIDKWLITDRKSLNGVLVNDQAVKPGSSRFLVSGDVICFGRKQAKPELEFVFEVAGAAPRPPRPCLQAAPRVPPLAAEGGAAGPSDAAAASSSSARPAKAARLAADAAQASEVEEQLKKLRAEQQKLEQTRQEFEETKRREEAEIEQRRQEMQQEADKARAAAVEAEVKRCQQNSLQIKELQSELVCPICQDWLIDPMTLECAHPFCDKCIDEWLCRKVFECPVCRKEVAQEPRGSRAIVALVEKSVGKLPEAERQEFKKRQEDVAKHNEERKRLHAKLEVDVENALSRGKSFFNIGSNWSKKDKETFQRGLADYHGGARGLYCKLVGLTPQWIYKATDNQLNLALHNLRLPKWVDKGEDRIRQRLLMFLRYA